MTAIHHKGTKSTKDSRISAEKVLTQKVSPSNCEIVIQPAEIVLYETLCPLCLCGELLFQGQRCWYPKTAWFSDVLRASLCA